MLGAGPEGLAPLRLRVPRSGGPATNVTPQKRDAHPPVLPEEFAKPAGGQRSSGTRRKALASRYWAISSAAC